MSRRRNTRRRGQEPTTCVWCKAIPTRDGAYVCEEDLDAFVAALRELLPRPSDRALSFGLVRYAETVDRVVVSSVLPGDEADATALVETVVRAEWCPYPRPAELVPGLWDDLLNFVSGERGIDYRTVGGSGGLTVDDTALEPGERRGVVPTGIVLPERAAEIGAVVTRSLRALVLVCMEARVPYIDPAGPVDLSSRLVPAMVEWLLWRVDGIALHPEAAQHAQHVFEAVEAARWVVDRPETRQQLGDCLVPDCPGHLTATPYATYAHCDHEGHAVEAQPLRDQLLDDLDDRLCTAAEIARLSTYLQLRQPRDAVRKRVNQWGHRDRIKVRAYDTPTDDEGELIPPYAGPFCRSAWCGHSSCPVVRESRGPALYLFGEVYDLLLAANPSDDTSDTDSKGA